MTDIKTIEGTFTGGKGKYSIVVGRWNSFVVEPLLKGALDTLRRHGVSDKQITIVRAPGAFEIPLVCKKVAAKGNVDAIIALGAVIRGGTPHFEYVAGECTKGIAMVSMEYESLSRLAYSQWIPLSRLLSDPGARPATRVKRPLCPHWRWLAL